MGMLHNIVSEFVDANKPFDIIAVIAKVKEQHGDLPDVYSSIMFSHIRHELIRMYEQGQIIGYYITTKFAVGEDGRATSCLEFKPTKRETNIVELGVDPIDPVPLKCRIERTFSADIRDLAQKYGVTKEKMIRIMLVKAIELVDQKD